MGSARYNEEAGSPRPGGFILGRNLAQNAIEVDTHARALAVRAPAGNIAILLLFDMEATFLSVCRQFLRMAAPAVASPAGALRVVEALHEYNRMCWRGKGTRLMVTATSGVSQDCPLSGCLFILAADPVVRATHAAVGKARAGMVRWCADDNAALLLDLSHLMRVAPAICAAEHAARLRLKVTKCVLVPTLPSPRPADVDRCIEALRAVAPEWGAFAVRSVGKYLGVCLWPDAQQATWA